MQALFCCGTVLGTLVAAESATPAKMYDVRATTSTTIRRKADGESGKVLLLDSEGKWVDAKPTVKNGLQTLHIDAGQLRNGQTTLLIDPPPWLNVNDRTAPDVRALTIDGRSIVPANAIDLGASETTPESIVLRIVDADNPLKDNAINATLDGAPLPLEHVKVEVMDRQAICRITPGEVDFGPHQIQVKATDASPFANETAMRIRFTRSCADDISQASAGATVKVDSCFAGYGAHTLIDGESQGCANAGSPGVSWASAETDAEHWVEVTLPKAETIDQVTLFWTYKKPSKHVEIQIPEGDAWNTIGTAVRNKTENVASTIPIPLTTTNRIRIYQPPKCGQEDRPNLLWLGEIAVRKSK